MFSEISKMSTMLQAVAADILTIKETTNELKNTVNGIQVRLDEAEGRISHLEDKTDRLVSNGELKKRWKFYGIAFKCLKTIAREIT